MSELTGVACDAPLSWFLGRVHEWLSPSSTSSPEFPFCELLSAHVPDNDRTIAFIGLTGNMHRSAGGGS